MPKFSSNKSRNFGYGKTLKFAARNALQEHYQGHFKTIQSHLQRWIIFIHWLSSKGIKDAHKIDQLILEEFGLFIKQKHQSGSSIAYCQNILSSCNTCLKALRGTLPKVWISPCESVGAKRSHLRTTIPKGMKISAITEVADQLRKKGLLREASVLELCRFFGLRLREATLLDIFKSIKEAEKTGYISITLGVKGGKRPASEQRQVKVTEKGLEVLTLAKKACAGTPNLIPEQKTQQYFQSRAQRIVLKHLHDKKLGTIKDLRAAFACDLYEETAGHLAPVMTDERTAPKDKDDEARKKISVALGHKRKQISGGYCGGY